MSRSYRHNEYTGPKAVSKKCRGRDGCPACTRGRTLSRTRKEQEGVSELDAWQDLCKRAGARRVDF